MSALWKTQAMRQPSRWCTNRISKRHAFDSILQKTAAHSESFSPGSDTHGFAAVSYQVHASRIAALCFRAGPPAVFRFVISIAVNAVKTLSLWTRAHILQEVFKLQPPIAGSYSPAPVIFPSGMAGMRASIEHPAPDGVRSRVSPPMPEIGIELADFIFHRFPPNLSSTRSARRA